MSERRGDWIRVYSGRRFYPLDPRPEDIDIADISVGLSNVCRYSGQVEKFYSVAQHSVLVSRACFDRHNLLWGLLHDASEAYIGDMARPIKMMAEMAAYRESERLIMAAVAERFGLSPAMPHEIKRVDNVLLKAEATQFYGDISDWHESVTGAADYGAKITPWTPARSRREFMARFDKLRAMRPLMAA